jgi:hypothetical protein
MIDVTSHNSDVESAEIGRNDASNQEVFSVEGKRLLVPVSI